MFTTESPTDLRFIKWVAPIVQDIQDHRRVSWVDEDTLDGHRTGTLRGYTNDISDDIRQANVRVTLDSGWEHEVLLVDLMNAASTSGYARH